MKNNEIKPTSLLGRYSYRKMKKHINTLNDIKDKMPEDIYLKVYKLFNDAWADAFKIGWMNKKNLQETKAYKIGYKEGGSVMSRILRGDFRIKI